MSKSKKRNNPKASKYTGSGLPISGLDTHRRQGGNLVTPLNGLGPNVQRISWRDLGVVDMLWAVLLRGNLERDHCLRLFREVVVNARENMQGRKDTFVTHSVLGALKDATFDQMLSPIFSDSAAREFLRPVLFFDCLPDRRHWQRHLKIPDPATHSTPLLKAVALSTDHQSLESTDIRWFKVMYLIIACEKLQLPMAADDESESMVEELRLYPDCGDQKKVRPLIRSMEMTLRMEAEAGHPSMEVPDALRDTVSQTWREQFWKEALYRTRCIAQDHIRSCPWWWCRRRLIGLPERPPRVWRRQADQWPPQ